MLVLTFWSHCCERCAMVDHEGREKEYRYIFAVIFSLQYSHVEKISHSHIQSLLRFRIAVVVPLMICIANCRVLRPPLSFPPLAPQGIAGSATAMVSERSGFRRGQERRNRFPVKTGRGDGGAKALSTGTTRGFHTPSLPVKDFSRGIYVLPFAMDLYDGTGWACRGQRR